FRISSTTHFYTPSLHDALPISLSTVKTSSIVGSVFGSTFFAESVMIARVLKFKPTEPLKAARLPPEIVTSYSWSLEPLTTLTLRSEEHTSELQSRFDLVCRLLL